MTHRAVKYLTYLATSLFLASGAVMAQDIRDSDWSHSFYSNCPLPTERAVGWVSQGGDRKAQFILSPGDTGGCGSDDVSRGGAPFWERAELKQRGTLPIGQRHEIRFQASFQDGFKGTEETFFQIHGWTPTCSSAPLMMMQFNRGKMDVKVLQRSGDPFSGNGVARGNKGGLASAAKGLGINRKMRLNRLGSAPHEFRVVLDTKGKFPRISVWMDGTPLVQDKQMYIRDCSVPHVKFGLYRPGKQNRATSVLWIDDVQISSS